MKLKIILITSVLVNIWFASTIISLEKFHYSTMVGLCSEMKIENNKVIRTYDNTEMYNCLRKSEPRMSVFYNLAYGLKIL